MNSLPHELYTAEQTRELDRLAIQEFGMSGTILMERAGEAAYRYLRHSWPNARHISVVCGAGNNGGDGYVIARLAREEGLAVDVYQIGDLDKQGGDALAARQRLEGMDVSPVAFQDQDLRTADVIIDALLGTGVQGEVKEEYARAIHSINTSGKPVLAVDVPSGLNATTGLVQGVAVRASHTISFIGMKQGLLTADGLDYCGELSFSNLNLPAEIYARVPAAGGVLDFSRLKSLLGKRPRNSHKGDFGHVLIIGGDKGMHGAVRLAGEAALRSGAGLVSIATRTTHAALISSTRPELMCHGVETATELHPLLEKASVIAIGPGLGSSAWSLQMWLTVSTGTSGKPVVVDADALRRLADDPQSRDNWILTPHPGEAARLLDISARDVQVDRFAAAQHLQQKYGGVVVLKGAGTVVATPQQRDVCPAGNPGMSSAGMGDVLTGITSGLLGQGLAPQDAARLGVCVHAAAGDQAARMAGERGLLASDMMANIRRLVNENI